jgi:uncharacterized protein (DUF433 family)
MPLGRAEHAADEGVRCGRYWLGCVREGFDFGSDCRDVERSSSRLHVGVAFERITVNPDQMGGMRCIRGLRVTVSAVVGQLAAGRTIEQVLEDDPYLEREDVFAALEYAAAAVSERDLPTPAA